VSHPEIENIGGHARRAGILAQLRVLGSLPITDLTRGFPRVGNDRLPWHLPVSIAARQFMTRTNPFFPTWEHSISTIRNAAMFVGDAP
jgi:hypothetical protein